MSDISGLSSKVALNDPSLAPCTPGRIAWTDTILFSNFAAHLYQSICRKCSSPLA